MVGLNGPFSKGSTVCDSSPHWKTMAHLEQKDSGTSLYI